MKVDRHNYEEFFLLYIDNELSVDQKKQVDLFVQENADLEEGISLRRFTETYGDVRDPRFLTPHRDL